MVRMHDAPIISPENKNSSREIIETLPKVDLHVRVPAAGDPREDVHACLEKLAADRVVYAELRVSPESYEGRPAEIISQALEGLDVPGIDARLVIEVRKDTGRAEEIAGLAVECAQRDPRVVGADFAGHGSLDAVAQAAAVLRQAYVPFSVQAGAEDFEEISQAVQLGATRIGFATAVLEDFTATVDGIVPGKVSSWLRDRRVAIESAPLHEQRQGALDDIEDHPLPLLHQLGFTCAICTGDVASGSLTDMFEALHERFTYGLEEFFEHTVKALDNAYCAMEDRQHILETYIVPGYQAYADAEYAEDAAFAGKSDADAEDGEQN